MCPTTLLSTPASSQTFVVRSIGSKRKSQIRRAARSALTELTSATSRVNLDFSVAASMWRILIYQNWAGQQCPFNIFPNVPTCSRSPGPLQPAEPSRDGPTEGAASGCLPPADGDQEEPDGAGEQQHGDPDRHLQTPSDHYRVSA